MKNQEVFEEIMVKEFPKLVKEFRPQIQAAYQTAK